MSKKIILFIPSIEKGGAEKNLFIISNYLSNRFKKLTVISATKKAKKKFNKRIEFLCPDSEIWDIFGRGIKTIISILFLIKKILQDRKILVLSFQSNIYAIIICKIFSINIITRSNSFPDDWTKSGMTEKQRYFMMGNALVCEILFKLSNYISKIIET